MTVELWGHYSDCEKDMQQSRPISNLYNQPDVTHEGHTHTLIFHHIYLLLPRHG